MTQSIEQLQAELESARAMEAATTDILRIIRESPEDLEGALAAIAIENAFIRELRESDARMREALDAQGVMARVLSVIAGAPCPSVRPKRRRRRNMAAQVSASRFRDTFVE